MWSFIIILMLINMIALTDSEYAKKEDGHAKIREDKKLVYMHKGWV